ncbi:MAG: AbrB/MazE/SpoVT family DNA-binding domain-containing protein [Nitrospiraceae bacterium]|nr:AbrB/MazE/SpoVT family DNA-binding domain-containing protein [Nitrospiraceae bacterium]
MKTVTVSAKGQIALPKEIRKALNIETGSRLTTVIKDGKLILEPAVSVPRSQAWYWTPEWQAKVSAAMKAIEEGDFEVLKSTKEVKKRIGA